MVALSLTITVTVNEPLIFIYQATARVSIPSFHSAIWPREGSSQKYTHTHRDVQTGIARSRLRIHLLGRWKERDALKSGCAQTWKCTDTGVETSSLSHTDRRQRTGSHITGLGVCVRWEWKGQCEAGTIVTRFQVCSLCVCVLRLGDLEMSGWYNVVVEGRNRLRKRVCKCTVISALKLLMSVWNGLSLGRRVCIYCVLFSEWGCFSWCSICVPIGYSPVSVALTTLGRGFRLNISSRLSPLLFLFPCLSLSLSLVWAYTRNDFRIQNTDELVCTNACLCTLNRSYHPPECDMYVCMYVYIVIL